MFDEGIVRTLSLSNKNILNSYCKAVSDSASSIDYFIDKFYNEPNNSCFLEGGILVTT